MKIFREGNWRTTFGFYKYSSQGTNFQKSYITSESMRITDQEINENDKHQMISQSKIYEYSSLTNDAMSLAKQLVNIASKSHLFTVTSNISEMFNSLLKQLEWYIRQGANKTYVLDYLRQHVKLKNLKH